MSEDITITLSGLQAQRISAGRMVIREKHHFNLSKRHCAVIDALVMESLSQGEASVVIPSSQVLTELCGVPVQHVPKVIAELVTCRILQTRPTEDGLTRYTINPDSEHWRVQPIVGRETAAAARSLVATLNGRRHDSLPANFKGCACIPAFGVPPVSCSAPCGRACGDSEAPTDFLHRSSVAGGQGNGGKGMEAGA